MYRWKIHHNNRQYAKAAYSSAKQTLKEDYQVDYQVAADGNHLR